MKNIIFLSLFIALLSTPLKAQKWKKSVDDLLEKNYPEKGPGATVLVSEKGNVLYTNAVGMADLENEVKNTIDHKFEIGSITKQITAVSILMLMEEGKLNLEDSITKFLPDYPVHGHYITIHHLLNHTSGIKSYTSLESWQEVWRQDLSLEEMIDLFKSEPMDFAPGTDWRYNNSGYILLGAIIEEVSGMAYADFIEERIFKELGMNNSLYGSQELIVPNRARGYQMGSENYQNAEYLSLTQPYAAGSVMSTVGDLNIWNDAMRKNLLISEDSRKIAWTDYKTSDGMNNYYGYGWGFREINGSPTVEHSGGIFGYVSNGIYMPEEDVYVVILSNTDNISATTISTKIAGIVIGKPYGEEKEVKLTEEQMKALVGVYTFDDGSTRTIKITEGKLISQRTGGSVFGIHALSPTEFYFEDSFVRLKFNVEDGQAVSVETLNRGIKQVAVLKTKEIKEKNEIFVSKEILATYVGEYEIAENFILYVTLDGDNLMSQATGQEKIQVFPESETRFFLKVVDAQLEFAKNEDNEVTHVTLFQGGQSIKCIKVK